MKKVFTSGRLLNMLVLLVFALSSCGTNSSEVIVAPTATHILPTLTVLPTVEPSPTPLPLFPLDGLRMAYIIDGDLYLQDSGKQQVQLTNSGEDYSPIFSSDGEKIVFFRGVLPYTVYSINADGSQEKELVSTSLLAELNLGYSEATELRSLSFVPGTHQLLFNTHELDQLTLNMKDLNRLGAKPNQDLLMVDTDTAEIKRILDLGNGGMFQVSPDGNLVGIQSTDHIDVIGLDGKVIYRNLATYPSAWLGQWTPDIYWTQDSVKLNVVLPIATEQYASGPELRTIWQYSMDGSPASQTHLNPSPVGNSFNISPDGNWVVYTYYYYPGKTDETVTPGIYLGSLKNGSSAFFYGTQYGLPFSFNWSQDSANFIFDNSQSQTQLFLGDVDETVTPLGGGQFISWIDENRCLYSNGMLIRVREIGREESVTVAKIPEGIKYFTVVFLK